MNLKDPESLTVVIGKVLRYGVILSAAVVLIGTALLVVGSGGSDPAGILTYYPDQLPHSMFDLSFSGLLTGLASFGAYSWIQLGIIILIATPVCRVLISVLLFAAERDKLYVAVTAVVLALLLFSMFVTPFIPLFQS